MNKYATQSGQVVLITLLVLTIATTVALSLISRTTTDTTITNQVEESSRAFNAAEAGVEEALKTGLGTNNLAVSIVGAAGVTYKVVVNNIGGATGIYQFPKKIQQDETETLWLVNHDDITGLPKIQPTYIAPSIDVCWSDETVTPAIVVTLLYQESSDASYRVAKIAFDPDAVRAESNQFTSTYIAGGCGGTTATAYKETITFNDLNASIQPAQDTLIALRVRPVYSDATIDVNTGVNTIPKQGLSIESTGTTTNGINRKILVYQQYRAPATVFDSALYSQSDLVQ